MDEQRLLTGTASTILTGAGRAVTERRAPSMGTGLPIRMPLEAKG